VKVIRSPLLLVALGKPDDATTSSTTDYEGDVRHYDTWMSSTLGSTTYSVDFINGHANSKSTV
jgi:hypothetical protein